MHINELHHLSLLFAPICFYLPVGVDAAMQKREGARGWPLIRLSRGMCNKHYSPQRGSLIRLMPILIALLSYWPEIGKHSEASWLCGFQLKMVVWFSHTCAKCKKNCNKWESMKFVMHLT
jgi:hypothetical protein